MTSEADPVIATERLILRPLTENDAQALLAYRSLPEVCRYVPFEPMDEAQIFERIRGQWSELGLHDPGAHRTLGVEERETGRLVGDVILMLDRDDERKGEIGYVFTPSVAGRGYATEAARALIDFAFDALHLHRVIGRIDSRHTASGRVLQRVGMRKEAEFVEDDWFKGEWSSTTVFAILQREWRDARETPPTY
jgi:RimJ/RimL family protein N-acetyltransferase